MVVDVFVGDGCYVCSTKPSLLADAFVHRSKVPKNQPFIQKINGFLFRLEIIAFCVKFSCPAALHFFFPANYLHVKIHVTLYILP